MYVSKLLALSVACLGTAAQLLHVTGTGRESVRSAVTVVHLAVQKSASQADAAQNATGTAVEKVIRALNEARVQRLQTESVVLQPVYNYTDTPPRILSCKRECP